MRYAIAIWNFARTASQVRAAVRRFVEAGFDCVSLKPENVLNISGRDQGELIGMLAELNIQVTIHGDLNMSIAQVRRLVDALDGRLTILSLDPRCRIDPDGAFFQPARHMPLLDWLVESCRSFGLEFCIEDFPLDRRSLVAHRRDLQPVLDCPAFGILLDAGHMNLRLAENSALPPGNSERQQAPGTVEAYLGALPVSIKEIHLHDNAADDDTHMPLGRGTLDLEALVVGLSANRFDGTCTVEVSPHRYGRRPETEIPHAIETMQRFGEAYAAIDPGPAASNLSNASSGQALPDPPA